jgi:hypothetical protein
VAALSIVSLSPTESRAEVLGDIGHDNAEWLTAHLHELEGDVTLDCHRSAFLDPDALMVLVEFEEFLRQRGNRLVIDGVPEGADSVSGR